MTTEPIFTPYLRYRPKILGKGRTVEEAREDAEFKVKRLCRKMGYDFVLYGRYDEDVILQEGDTYYCKRESVLVKNLPEN